MHEAKPPFELDRPAVIEDVADCFVDVRSFFLVRPGVILTVFPQYLCNDTVGQIANIHLCLADRSSQHGFDPECQKLADLHRYTATSHPLGTHRLTF